MATVTVKYACGHTQDAWVGETSSAGIGAAAAALKRVPPEGRVMACPACRELPTDEEGDLKSVLADAERQAKRELDRYLLQPDRTSFWLLIDALRVYEAAWEDLEQARNR